MLLLFLLHVVFSCNFALAKESPRSETADSSDTQLIFVTVLYRHGNRTVLNPYPNDPYKNASFWPEGLGQLTKVGMLGHYKLGQWMRRRYNELIPMEYSINDIHVQSTDVDRTLMSAYSHLAGLYEPDAADNWNPKIHWRPIPVHTIPQNEDDLLSMSKPCPKYDSILRKFKASDWFVNILEKNKFLLQTLSDAAGKPVKDMTSVEYLYDTLFIESLNQFELPEWTQTVFPEPMKSLADLSFAVPCFNQNLARLKIGSLIKEIVSTMSQKANGTLSPDRKMFMYSAHDTTVANVLRGLGVFNGIAPPYFSTILIELRMREDQHFVTMLYKNGTDVVYPLVLPGCSTMCPLEKFVEVVRPVTIKDRDKECRLAFLEDLEPLENLSMVTGTAVASLLILLVSVLCFVCRKPKIVEKEGFMYQSLSAEAT